jgi:hypothetical protein
MESIDYYFPRNSRDSTERILSSAEEQGFKIEKKIVSIPDGPRGIKHEIEELPIYFATYEPPQKYKMIGAIANSHGNEFVGSTFMLRFLENFPKIKNLENVGAYFTFPFNPYGHHYIRRGNENNHDLERSAVTDWDLIRKIEKNDKYTSKIREKLRGMISPRGQRFPKILEPLEWASFYGSMINGVGLLGSHDLNSIYSAVVRGNLEDREYVFSAVKEDQETPQSIKHYREFLRKITPDYDELWLFNVHAGIGPEKSFAAITDGSMDQRDKDLLRKLYPHLSEYILPKIKEEKLLQKVSFRGKIKRVRELLKDTWSTEGIAQVQAYGTLDTFTKENSQCRVLPVTIDFHTKSIREVFRWLVAENQVHHNNIPRFGSVEEALENPEIKHVKNTLFEKFNFTTPDEQTRVLGQIDKILDNFSRLVLGIHNGTKLDLEKIVN